jgi:hypothetical protein
MSNLNDPVSISSIPNLNKGLSAARVSTMVEALGRPREPLSQHECRDKQASPNVVRLRDTRKITAHLTLRGIKPALDSIEGVLAKVKAENSELIEQLRTDGMICVRHKKPTDGSFSNEPSNHSWGTAVDFKLAGHGAPGNTGSKAPRFIAIMAPFFNEAGWYSGIGFHDTMHFEVADETIRKWKEQGLLPEVAPEDKVVITAGGGNIFKPISDFFGRLFGRG